MFPIPLYIEIGVLVIMASIGFGVGAFTGWVISRTSKVAVDGLGKDGFLGSLGFVLGFVGCILAPFVTGGGMFPYPHLVALASAVALPTWREWSRSRKIRA